MTNGRSCDHRDAPSVATTETRQRAVPVVREVHSVRSGPVRRIGRRSGSSGTCFVGSSRKDGGQYWSYVFSEVDPVRNRMGTVRPLGGGVIYISHPNWVVLGCVDFDLLDADDLHKARQTQRV